MKEKSIKNLKEYIERDPYFNGTCKVETDFDKFCYEHCKDIENLIKRNKELEEENRNIKNHIYYKEVVELNYIPNERLIHYMDVALENSKQCLRKGNKIRANEEYKRYKDLKDIVDDLVYHKTLAKGDK